MLRRILWILALLLTAFGKAAAQYDPSYSHYWAMETAYNPAAAGKLTKLNAVVAYDMALVGFRHNPQTMFAAADMPLNLMGMQHGAGVRFVNDAIGLFSHRNLGLQYAFKQRLLGGTLSVGIDAALLSENFNGDKLEVETPNDPAFSTTQITGSSFDLGAGLYYVRRNWYAGVSALHLLAPTVRLGETNELAVARSYYFTAGGNIRLRNPFLSVHPSVLGRTDAVGYRADITARLQYTHEQRVMYVGLGYSPANSVTVYLGGNFHGVRLGYSYEAYTNGVSFGMGSHALFAGYQTDVNFFKKGRNKHQSVRTL